MIESLLALSTGHLTEQTCNLYLPTAPFSAFEKGEVGWFIYATDDPPKDIPADLAQCILHARHLGCAWLMFDSHYDLIEGLPDYTGQWG
ncbi:MULTISPECIES: DUF5983 family protein [unclassified Novosphingobium]|uniref:DUF5983 family protein n=1 Tax=unclassified Novosphingobium TaxID=2644732 RepID=UPI00086EAC1D|nr:MULTISPECIES: hypothetical protein [unclassified Novosphingobium]MBN9142355.1 hypothetical protein [Novosphingobium sp.]ODU77644.1 MAG: hypothetical protein ABT10_24270 [Novosphingobium sp. SCN 63-17]OJX90163.1 MAG: hypothetical protein BGP00_21445 [Novosphingobium sp. 63-713]